MRAQSCDLANRMDRDFKIGMICGVVLASVALLWVVTRPTLTTQARMFSPSTASSQETPQDVGSPTTEQDRVPSDAVAGRQPETSPTPAAMSPLDSIVASRPLETAQTRTETREPNSTVFERDEKITTTRFHIVQKGETLSGISQQYYGTANKWQDILKANELSVKDANKIRPGTKLVIP